MGRSGRRLRVLPDADRVEEALVAEAAARRGFADGSGFLTFGQLVERLDGSKFLGRRPATPLAARVVLWGCAQALGTGPFGAFVQEPAFARSALELVLELKGGSLPPDAFRAAVESLPPARVARASYLARLYAAYEVKLSELKLADREDSVRGAMLRLDHEGLPPFLRDFGTIEVRDLHDFPPLRLELLFALGRACEKAGVDLRVELPGAGKAEIDLAVDPVFARFERTAQESRHLEAVKSDFVYEGRPLAGLGKYLFSADVKRGAAKGQAEGLELLSAGTVREEARQLAVRAAACISDGVPPEQIAIAFRDLGEEAEWVAEALEELGIPARVRLGAPLASTSAGRLALELPLLVDDGFPAERMAWLVGSRYLPEVSRGAPDSPAALLALASVRDDRMGARDGKGAYQVRLSALAERLERRGDYRAKVVRSLLERCQKLIESCSEIPAEGKPLELLSRWRRCVERLGLAHAVKAGEVREAEHTAFGRAVLRSHARDQAAAEALGDMATELEEALRVSGAGAQPMARRTFHRWLTDAAADFNLSPRGPRGGAVRIVDVRELAGRSFEHLCLGGLVDGRFPGRPTPHPLFSDDDRRSVNVREGRDVFRLSQSDGQGRAPWRLAEDRLLLFLALCATRGGATLSFARANPSGQEQIASPFLDELERLTGLKVEHKPARALPLLDEVLTEAELRERVALEVLARRSVRTSQPDEAASAMRRRFEQEEWLQTAQLHTRIEEERLGLFANPEREAGPFSGLVGSRELLPEVQRLFRFDADKPLSASDIRKFGNCAFQGFLSYALRLGEREQPGEEPDSKVQGTFWHKVLEELFPRLKAKGLLRRPAEEVPDALIDEAVKAAIESLEARDHVGHPALWGLEHDRARAMVRRLLNSDERGLPFDGHEPAFTELRFGHPEASPEWRHVAIPGGPGEADIHVQGKIDRVDVGGGALGVVDYKGSVKAPGQLWEELLTVEFQLPLYLYAARASGHDGAMRAAWLGLRHGELRTLNELLE
ncbi:MAG TPA: PD-(D/E)XK nuclease family protein, partial [Longimicrobium sp.]|nr:PD-(D/E)XK nuclease family protein [Longimicrobium sp.]